MLWTVKWPGLRIIHEVIDCRGLQNWSLRPLIRSDDQLVAMIHLNTTPHIQNAAASARPHAAGGVQQAERAKASTDSALVKELQSRDQTVRADEQAHIAASGGLAKGSASFQFTRGPDGGLYAISGEVQIDTAAVSDDPQGTIDKAQQIRRAALAPANPSQQDRAVAAQANAMATEAKVELQRAEREEAAARETSGGDLNREHDRSGSAHTGGANSFGRFIADSDRDDTNFNISV